MRVKRIGLEHHGEAALGGHRLGSVAPVDQNVATRDIFKPGDQAQKGRLAAARRADEDHELAVFDGEIERRDHFHIAERFGDLVELDLSHVRFPYFTAPKVRPRTSCFWLNQPMIRIGAMAMVEAAESLA